MSEAIWSKRPNGEDQQKGAVVHLELGYSLGTVTTLFTAATLPDLLVSTPLLMRGTVCRRCRGWCSCAIYKACNELLVEDTLYEYHQRP